MMLSKKEEDEEKQKCMIMHEQEGRNLCVVDVPITLTTSGNRGPIRLAGEHH